MVNQILSLKLNSGDTIEGNIITGGTNSFYDENVIMPIIYTVL